jgi:hypothetical protein
MAADAVVGMHKDVTALASPPNKNCRRSCEVSMGSSFVDMQSAGDLKVE